MFSQIKTLRQKDFDSSKDHQNCHPTNHCVVGYRTTIFSFLDEKTNLKLQLWAFATCKTHRKTFTLPWEDREINLSVKRPHLSLLWHLPLERPWKRYKRLLKKQFYWATKKGKEAHRGIAPQELLYLRSPLFYYFLRFLPLNMSVAQVQGL